MNTTITYRTARYMNRRTEKLLRVTEVKGPDDKWRALPEPYGRQCYRAGFVTTGVLVAVAASGTKAAPIDDKRFELVGTDPSCTISAL